MSKGRKSAANVLAKECVVSALLKLIYEKPLSSITISELCKLAGVSRMTFYRNYESKEDIFKKQLAELFQKYKDDGFRKPRKGIYYDKEHMMHYFTYIYRYREFMDGLMHCGFGIVFLEMLDEYMLEEWSYMADRYTLTAFSGALFNMFRFWSEGNYEDRAQVLAARLEKLFCENASA